ncbi:MAG: BamA/TamA family outer membrane protein [Kofleriaceae bacterium]
MLFAIAPSALADSDPAPVPTDAGIPAPPVLRPIVGFRVRGASKLTERTLGWIAHVDLGEMISEDKIPEIETALMSSELFKSAVVTLEPSDNGVLVVATLDDKMSWIAAPTVFILPSHYSVGAGYAESNLGGENKKMLLYAQYGNLTSLVLGTFLDPAVHGSKWETRFDVYLLHQVTDEYSNVDPRSFAVERESTETFLDAGALVGYRFAWWLVGETRLRGAYVYFRDSNAGDAAKTPVAAPQTDGWDVTLQGILTLDHRSHHFGVTWGPYVQLQLESSIPGIDSYGYQTIKSRAYYSWKFFAEHELEVRTRFQAGRRLPFHEDITLGGASDLRGYSVDQFRGNLATMARAEYSVPIYKYNLFAFRALAFYDMGYVRRGAEDLPGRAYLADQPAGTSWFRSDVGGGLRVYVSTIVLPLLGFDIAYGIESHAPEYYFELGLTDF